MKNKFIKLALLSIVFALSCGLAINESGNDAKFTQVEAAQYLDDYDPYYYEGTFYDSFNFELADGKDGSLRQALTTLIKPKGFYEYSGGLASQLQFADQDPTNSSNMVYLYTRDSVKKNSASTWNREHVWPQSLSNGNWGTGEAGCDMLHIRPTYNSTNSARGNTLYGNNNKSGPVYYNNMLYGYTGGTYFEPIDEVKGDVARIIMYLYTAYTGWNGYSALNIMNVFDNYDTLLKWHTMDKPDMLEGKRNDYCQTTKQGNRNPFVDHPEFAWRIFGGYASSTVYNDCKDAYPSNGTIQPTKVLQSITLTGEPTHKEYYVGQTFNPSGLTVTAYYDDGSSKTIDKANCIWSPDPLTEGTTAITCKYGNCAATYTGITVRQRQSVEGEYSVEFTQTADSGTDITATSITSYYKTNNLVKSVTGLQKIYPGEKGLKMGSSSTDGTITFNLVDAAQNNIVKVIIKTTDYKGSGSFTAKLGDMVIGNGISAGTMLEQTLLNVSASKITISGSGRLYLNSITVEISQATQSPSSSSNPNSSSTTVSSSSEEQSSSDYSGGQDSCSYCIDISSDQSSDIDIPSSTEMNSVPTDSSSNSGENKKRSGCNGSLVVAPFTGISSLVGLIFVFSKKKKK